MSAFFDYIQTFYVVPDAVNGSSEVMLTSIDLFFKAKPDKIKNITGLSNPGLTLWICEVLNNDPIPQKVLNNSITVVGYDQINTSGNASSATNLSFKKNVSLKSGKYYGIVIKYDDPAFDIWVNKQGDRLVSSSGVTNITSTGSQGRFEGNLYKATNANDYISLSDRDLKFKVNIAKFISTNGTFTLSSKNYEFFTIGSYSGSFIGGEWVYQNVADKSGLVSVSSSNSNIIGVGTTFTDHYAGQNIFITNGTDSDILKIKNITNTTFMSVESLPSFTANNIGYKVPPLGKVYYTDYTKNIVYLVDSNAANSTFNFVPGVRIIGERSGASANVVSLDKYKIDNFTPKFSVSNPSTSDFSISYNIANSTNYVSSSFTNMELLKENSVSYPSYVLSRSQEVIENNLYGASKKSAAINVTLNVNSSNNNLFSAPYINADELDFYVYQNDINSSFTETRYGVADFDTEIEKNGLAKSKWISKKIVFATDKSAEDIRCYVSAYRPAGTDIKLYAKIHNASDKETFDDKQWTPLGIKDNIDLYSSDDKNNYIEYTYGLKQYPDTRTPLVGTFNITNGSAIINTSVDQSTYATNGSLIKIFDPLIPENNEVFVALSSNSTTITLNKPVTNLNIVGNMYVDLLKYKNVAWNNIANDNIARYVNSALVEFDTFTTMQIKVVFVASSSHVSPNIDQIQVIGVSA